LILFLVREAGDPSCPSRASTPPLPPRARSQEPLPTLRQPHSRRRRRPPPPPPSHRRQISPPTTTSQAATPQRPTDGRTDDPTTLISGPDELAWGPGSRAADQTWLRSRRRRRNKEKLRPGEGPLPSPFSRLSLPLVRARASVPLSPLPPQPRQPRDDDYHDDYHDDCDHGRDARHTCALKGLGCFYFPSRARAVTPPPMEPIIFDQSPLAEYLRGTRTHARTSGTPWPPLLLFRLVRR
jgi:hypothetical protein